MNDKAYLAESGCVEKTNTESNPSVSTILYMIREASNAILSIPDEKAWFSESPTDDKIFRCSESIVWSNG